MSEREIGKVVQVPGFQPVQAVPMGQLASALAKLARSLRVATKHMQHAFDEQKIGFDLETRRLAIRLASLLQPGNCRGHVALHARQG